MSTAEINLVHETEVQRRHARVKIPSVMTLVTDQGNKDFTINDLSVSGVSFVVPEHTFQVGRNYNGIITFKINDVDFSVRVNFKVNYYSAPHQVAGCEFMDLKNNELSILRLFINKFLAGDFVDAGDVLSIMNRDNYLKSRKANGAQALSGFERAKAVGFTALFSLAGLLAFGFILLNIYQSYFITQSIAASVQVDSFSVHSPAEGYIKFVDQQTGAVNAAQQLAVVNSPMFDLVKQSIPVGSPADQTQLQELLPIEMSRLIESPCDCEVLDFHVQNHDFVKAGAPIVELVEKDASAYVQAMFHFSDADQLQLGQEVQVYYPTLAQHTTGVIEQVVIETQPRNINENTILVKIKTEQAIGKEMIHYPVNIALGPMAMLAEYF